MTSRSAIAAVALGAFAAGASVVASDPATGGPLSGVVVDAPFSAEATTTADQVLPDGRRVQHVATARYYRDAAGRVRVEQRIPSADGAAATVSRITILEDPAAPWVRVLDPDARTTWMGVRHAAAMAVGGGPSLAVPLRPTTFLVFHQGGQLHRRLLLSADATTTEPLGTRRVEGLEATGTRTVTTVPAGRWNNATEVQIIEERWESSDVRLLIYARLTNPLAGDVEYRVTGISRAQPPSDLFAVPSDFTAGGATADTIVLDFAEPPHRR